MVTIAAIWPRRVVRLSTTAVPGVVGMARACASAIADWRQKRSSRRILAGLTDDELRDIGITRREAMREVSKSYFWD